MTCSNNPKQPGNVGKQNIVREKSTKVSAWLIPSGKSFGILQTEIDRLSTVHNTPRFEPHVTLFGGVEITESSIPGVILKLQERFRGFGPIPCNVNRSKGIMTGYDEDRKKVTWNQSTVIVLDRDDKFMKAVRSVRAILLGREGNDEDVLFKPPLSEPHLSLAYCNEALSPLVELIPEDFDSLEMKLVATDPSTLEGVTNWVEVGKIPLS
jgi:hypothetical protein